jgi:hypothetical protein
MTRLARRVLVLCCFFLCLTPTLAISYTVQVVASSDEARATQLRDELARQGYPAYLLAVPTAQGQVYRIRVGAFANRAAAALFAQTMPSVEGSTPSPALADSVPPGLIPLEPALLGQYDLTTTLVQVFPWPASPPSDPQDSSLPSEEPVAEEATPSESSGANSEQANTGSSNTSSTQESSSEQITESASEEGSSAPSDGTNEPGADSSATTSENTMPESTMEETPPENQEPFAQTEPQPEEAQTQPPLMAIRIQPRDASQQATYRVGGLEFEAWKAAPSENGDIVRVRSLSVWPEEWQSVSEAERNQYRETVLANVANDLDLSPQQVEPFVFELENQAPFVVLVERFNPEAQTTQRLRAIGQPRPNEANLGLRWDGPSSFFGENILVPLPSADTVFEPSTTSEAPAEVMGSGWRARSDDDYVILEVEGKTWRAANGEPVWANGNLLISLYNSQVLIYQFQEP